MTFDKRQTGIAKGIAILLLMWRHFFYYISPEYSLFSVFGTPVEVFLNTYSMVCVAMFVLLSGYGLQASFNSCYEKNKAKVKKIKLFFKFVKKHIVRVYFEYILIFIIVYFFYSANEINIFNHIYQSNIWYLLLNILGISNFFGTPSLIPAWWFMGLILGLYVLFPIFWLLNKYCGEMLLLLSFAFMLLPGEWDLDGIRLWSFPFVFGMYLSERDLINKFYGILNTKTKKMVVCTAFLFTGFLLRDYYSLNTYKFDAFFAFSIIMISFIFLSRIPIWNKALYELGKKSSIMYLIHTAVFFMIINYLKLPVAVYSYIVAVILCFAVAWLITLFRKYTRYDKLVLKLSK